MAYYDADESDGWKTIHAFSGLHHGYEEMVIYGEMSESDNIDRDELRERRGEYSSIAKSKITDLSELARMAVACGWSEWGWDEEKGYDDEDWDDESFSHEQTTTPNGDDEESVDFHELPQIN